MIPHRIGEIDWSGWVAKDTATLVFVVEQGRVLLIRKKRGLGAGKINGPGGRVEAGETPEACAVREVQEELCITPREIRKGGEHRFQFLDGYSIHVHAFRATAHDGEPTETEEAIPLWFDTSRIPYEEMWEDDELWLPHLLAGTPVDGRFIFDGDRMVDHRLKIG
jgi:8-oxo-dGTP diphosphatase